MANNVIQIKKTTVSGRPANSTNTPTLNIGELALNLPDGILYSTNGTTFFTIGANLTNLNVTNQITVNGAVGTAGQALLSGGGTANDYWGTVSASPGGSDTQLQINESGSFGGSAALTFNYSSNVLTVNGAVKSTLLQTTTQTGTAYTTANTDSGTLIQCTNTASVTITISNTMPVNSRFLITQVGTGIVTVANQVGMNLSSRTGNYTIGNQFGTISVFIANSTTAIIDGNILGTGTLNVLNIGSSTPNTLINATSVNTGTFSVGSTFTANSTLVNAAAVNVTGAVNSASQTVTGLTNTNTLNVTGAVNTATVFATGSINAASVFLANSTALKHGTNTFTLGTSSVAANGYTYLPNGLLMQWGHLTYGSITSTISFPISFTINCYSLSVMSFNSTSANFYIGTFTKVGASITSNASSGSFLWTAIGS